jgi:hypothetical protein
MQDSIHCYWTIFWVLKWWPRLTGIQPLDPAMFIHTQLNRP